MIFFNVLVILLIATCGNGARILGVYPLSWGSHYILGKKMMQGLAEAGHDVTMITTKPTKDIPKHFKWTDVVLDGLDDEFKRALGGVDFLNKGTSLNPIAALKRYTEVFIGLSNGTLNHPEMIKLIKSGTSFDVVIVDQFLNDCHNVFAHIFKGHLIIASTIGPNPLVNSKVRNPAPVSTIPLALSNTPFRPEGLTFMERIKNLFFFVAQNLLSELYMKPLHANIVRENFPNAPDFHDLYHNVSLILLNSHSSLVEAVPMTPNMVEIGGYHIDPPQPLPKNLQTFLNDAKDGAIYFSLGSTLNSKDMPAEKKKAFIDVFKSLKQKVLWKFEEDLPNKPDNVLIQSWLPQQDILAHPNIKLFITHGGLLSATETVYHGKPVLSIPIFGDQQKNAEQVVKNGFGLSLDYFDRSFSEQTLRSLIKELLNNSKYMDNAKILSTLYHDRPMKPMENMVYWVEYVIRHNGAHHLRVPGYAMPSYAYYMVDVLFALVGVILLIVYIMNAVIKRIAVFFRKRSQKSRKIKKS